MKPFSDEELFNDYIASKIKLGYKIAIYGAGKVGEREICRLKDNDIQVDVVVDKNNYGFRIASIDVISIEKFIEHKKKYIIIYAITSLVYLYEVENALCKKPDTELVIKINTLNRALSMRRILNPELDNLYKNMFFDGKYSKNQFSPSYYYKDGLLYMNDLINENVTIKNGWRVVTKSNFNGCEDCKKIVFVGDSRFFSGACDNFTVPSFLQSKLNTKYKVENYTMNPLRFYEALNRRKSLKLRESDIVILNNLFTTFKDDKIYNSLSKEKLAFNYMNLVLEIKNYLDSEGVKFIFVWTPNIK